MKCFIVGFIVLLAITPVWGDEAEKKHVQEQAPVKKSAPEDERGNFWMNRKLKYTSNILQGMANGDFEAIARQAQAMRFLNKIEGFVRQKPVGYRDQLKAFDMAVDGIEEMAQKENLDGVTLSFHQLTVSCVQCHKQLRRADSLPQKTPPPKVPAQETP